MSWSQPSWCEVSNNHNHDHHDHLHMQYDHDDKGWLIIFGYFPRVSYPAIEGHCHLTASYGPLVGPLPGVIHVLFIISFIIILISMLWCVIKNADDETLIISMIRYEMTPMLLQMMMVMKAWHGQAPILHQGHGGQIRPACAPPLIPDLLLSGIIVMMNMKGMMMLLCIMLSSIAIMAL